MDQTVTLTEVGAPLDELLKKLNSKDLWLSADPTCAEQKLQIRLQKRPIRALMQALAQLLPGAWQPRDDKRGYKLVMDGKAVSEREDWWVLFLSEREKVFEQMRAFMLQQMRSERVKGEQFNISPQVEQYMKDGHDFFRLLPAALQGRIASQMNINPFYGYSSRGVSTLDEEGATVAMLSDLPQAAQEIVRARVPDATDKALLFFINGGIAVLVNVVLQDGTDAGARLNESFPILPLGRTVLTLNQAAFLNVAQHLKQIGRLEPNLPPGWEQLLAYQQSRVWKNAPPKEPRPGPPVFRRSEVLSRLGKTANMEFVADYYSLGGKSMSAAEQDAPPKGPLTEELNALAAQHDLSWKKRADNIYLFRDNRWYRDDKTEVPASLLRRWLALPSPSNPATLPADPVERAKLLMDRAAEFASALTPWQITMGLRLFVPEPEEMEKFKPTLQQAVNTTLEQTKSGTGFHLPGEGYFFWGDAGYILSQFSTVRFYAGLDDEARTALLENRLPFAALTPEQKKQALYLLPRLYVFLNANVQAPILLGFLPPQPKIAPSQRAGTTLGEQRLFIASPQWQ